MTVDGDKVEPCDPLFLTPGFRYYDLDEDRAEELPSADRRGHRQGHQEGRSGSMRVRFSRMPATLLPQARAKDTNKPAAEHINERLAIADATTASSSCATAGRSTW